MYNEDMGKHVIDMSEAEASREFVSLLARGRGSGDRDGVRNEDGIRKRRTVTPGGWFN
jgi:hypothetical protein